MKIVEYVSADNVLVEFQDDYKYRKRTIYQNFKSGQIKNPYDKSVHGVGCIGDGEFLTKESNGYHPTREYTCWIHMIERCYLEKNKDLHKSYYGKCTVCDEWLNFQNFAKWHSENYYEVNERLHLDKDILIPGNTLYAPDRCLLIPQRINELFTCKVNGNGLPVGITKTAKGKYNARYNEEKLGTFDTLEEAFEKYAEKKEETIKRIADEYIDIIPKKAYDAIYRYKVEMKNDKNVAA